MLTINRHNLKQSHQTLWFTIDLIMLVLLFINLGLIIFDSIYSFEGVQNALAAQAPAFQSAYHPVHQNFIVYDLMFVAVFLTEFAVRWIHAVHRKLYARWYFYPFIHWYDLIGCIPVGGLRFLRILRVVSIVYRLHRYGIIDFTQTRLFQFLAFYYEAFMEELSDRIVLKVLSGMQEEVRHGSPLIDRIQYDILQPRRDQLTDWISARVATAARDGYLPNRGAMRHYLESRVNQAIRQNPELSRLRFLPIFGSTVRGTLEESVSDIVANVIHQVMEDLSSSRNHEFIADLVDIVLPGRDRVPQTDLGDTSNQTVSARANDALIHMTLEVIDAIKDQVRHKRWREQL